MGGAKHTRTMRAELASGGAQAERTLMSPSFGAKQKRPMKCHGLKSCVSQV